MCQAFSSFGNLEPKKSGCSSCVFRRWWELETVQVKRVKKKSSWWRWKFWPLAGSAEAAAAVGSVIGAGGKTASQGLRGSESRVIKAGPTFQDNKVCPHVIEWLKIDSVNERPVHPAPQLPWTQQRFGCGVSKIWFNVGISTGCQSESEPLLLFLRASHQHKISMQTLTGISLIAPQMD